MTQEEKYLLLQDLCARLPYGVMIDYNNNEPLKVEGIVRNIVYFKGYNYQTEGDECYANITKCKPYLRPMSSMTEEEKKELYQKTGFKIDDYIFGLSALDWLNAHHFDYRNLIEKSMALISPEKMYK